MSVRFACVQCLQKILEEKVFFNTLKTDFKPEDTAFANFLILTALRRKTVIDDLLKTLLSKKIKNKHNILKYILLVGAVEILYMDTPDYAAINEYVNLAKRATDRFSAGMVNAVLRKIAQNKEQMEDRCRFPSAFTQILKSDYTENQIEKMQKMLIKEAPVDISVKENPEMWAQNLNGILFENGTIRLPNPKKAIPLLNGYHDGLWWVQDLAASLPVCFLKNLQGKKVLDLCAAPGGKTAQLLSKGATVTALDINPERIETLKQNMKRLNLTNNLSVICADAEEYLASTNQTFDYILLDAPCSATGTFRKHPEILHLKTLQDVQKQLALQQNLLSSSASCLIKGGILLYCTCSLSSDECIKQIEKFLNTHQNFKLEPLNISDIKICSGKKIDMQVIDKQVLRTLPYHMQNEGGADGIFACALKRIQ